MANVLAPFGFRHYGYLPGYAGDYQLAARQIQSTNTTKIFFGDPVSKVGSSAYITTTVGTTTILEGIFVGCEYVDSTGKYTFSPYFPGSTANDAKALLINAPGALFLVQALNTAIATSNIGQNFTFNIGTGSTTGMGLSGATLDQSSGTTGPAQFQVVALYPGVGNGSDPSTAFNWAVVAFNNQRFRTLTGVT